MSTSAIPARREWILIASFTLLGALVRLWNAHRLGILHFDEGIYALAGLWSYSPKGLSGLAPMAAFYSPPLFPTLIGTFYLLLGISDTAAVLVSVIAGVLTIPVASLLAKRSFGPGAGAYAAVLVALLGPHVALSRVALTDSTFLLLFLTSLALGVHLLDKPTFVRACGFGLAVGLAWLTKYNGFLAGLAVGVAAVPSLRDVREPAQLRKTAQTLGWLVVAGAVALAVYYPWYQHVQDHVPGGYAKLIQHHRGYLSPVWAWPRNALSQWAQAITLSGCLVGKLSWWAVSWPIACLGMTVAKSPASAHFLLRSKYFWLVVLAGCFAFGFFPDLVWWLALAALPMLLLRGPSTGGRILASALFLMTLLTPIYHPYARLSLPFQVLCLLLLCNLTQKVFTLLLAANQGWPAVFSNKYKMLAAGVILALVAVRVAAGTWPQASPGLLAPSDGLRWLQTLNDTPQNLETQVPERVYLLGRPSLIFYLNLGRQNQVVRLAGPEQLQTLKPPVKAGSGKDRYSVLVDGSMLATLPAQNSLPWNSQAPSQRPWNQGNLVTLLDLDPTLAYQPQKLSRLVNSTRNPETESGNSPETQPAQSQIFLYRSF